MSLFDEIWRANATSVLNYQFGESAQATYYDGSEVSRGSYDCILGPEQAVESEDDRGRRVNYQRTATLSWTDASPFVEPAIAATARLLVDGVTYSIKGILSRTPSAIVLVLHRMASQRRMAE